MRPAELYDVVHSHFDVYEDSVSLFLLQNSETLTSSNTLNHFFVLPLKCINKLRSNVTFVAVQDEKLDFRLGPQPLLSLTGLLEGEWMQPFNAFDTG